MKITSMKLVRVQNMPKDLVPGVLYYSEMYCTAAHLCACGCGAKIRTPIDINEWSLSDTSQGPTLNPSIGNWQQKCRSHYFIRKGKIIWCGSWTDEQILRGREKEQQARMEYYEEKYSKQGVCEKVWNWIKNKLGI